MSIGCAKGACIERELSGYIARVDVMIGWVDRDVDRIC